MNNILDEIIKVGLNIENNNFFSPASFLNKIKLHYHIIYNDVHEYFSFKKEMSNCLNEMYIPLKICSNNILKRIESKLNDQNHC